MQKSGKRPWTRSEKLLWAAPILLGMVVAATVFGPETARRTMRWPQQWNTAPNTNIRSMALSSNGEVVSAGGEISGKGGWKKGSGTIYLWNARTSTQLASIPPAYTRDKSGYINGWDVYGLTLSPDAKQIGFYRVGQKWELHDVATRALLWRFSRPVDSAEFSPDGHFIALSGSNSVFLVVDSDGQIRTRWKRSGASNSPNLSWSPDGTLVANIGSYDEGDPIELHRATDGKLVRLIKNRWTRSVAFSPDGKRLIATSSPHEWSSTDDFSAFAPLRCYDVTTGALIWEVKASTLGGVDSLHWSFCDAIFSPNGRVIAAYQHNNGQIFLLDGGTGAIKITLPLGRSKHTINSSSPALAFSPDGKRVFARGNDAILSWDL